MCLVTELNGYCTRGLPCGSCGIGQIIPNGEEASKMRVVAKAEINFMLRSMIEKPLKEGLEKIAEALSMIAY